MRISLQDADEMAAEHGAAQRLMVAALRQLQFSQTQHDRAIAIAASVARLAGATTIGPVHLAEAIQYHDRS
jgi:predicted ATPase with chaperone activity